MLVLTRALCAVALHSDGQHRGHVLSCWAPSVLQPIQKKKGTGEGKKETLHQLVSLYNPLCCHLIQDVWKNTLEGLPGSPGNELTHA